MDIIELGEDGSFDIPTNQVKQYKYESDDFKEFIVSDEEINFNESSLNSLEPGDFKIFSTADSKETIIVLRLPYDDKLTSVEINQFTLIISAEEKYYSIDLSSSIDKKCLNESVITCKRWKDFVNVVFSLPNDN